MAATTETIWMTVLSLPMSLASMVKPSEAAMERRPETRNSRPMTRTAIQGLTTPRVVGDEHDVRGGDHQLVGERVEQHADGGDLAAFAGEVAVEAVGDGGRDEDEGGEDLLLAVRAAERRVR